MNILSKAIIVYTFGPAHTHIDEYKYVSIYMYNSIQLQSNGLHELFCRIVINCFNNIAAY